MSTLTPVGNTATQTATHTASHTATHTALPCIIRVALPVPLFDLFDYTLNAAALTQTPPSASSTPHSGHSGEALIGCRVKVPFGSRQLIGVIISQSQHSDFSSSPLKAATELLDSKAVIPPDMMQLLQWAATYYHYPLGDVIATAMITLLRQGKSVDLLTSHWRVQADVNTALLARSPKQKQAFNVLQLHDARGAPESVLLMMGITRKQLQQLQARDLAQHFLEKPQKTATAVKLAQMPHAANPEQQAAINRIVSAQGSYQGFLLNGITGSGKTEVYLQAMQPVIEAGGQVLILVPEIGLTPQTISRFKARFHAHVVAMHSSMTDVARMNAWQAAFNGDAHIVIGTRSSIFIPLPRLGLIIIDEEHDLSYKQQDTFRYHARDIALYRAHLSHCPVVLGSATPSLETLHLVQEHKLTCLMLNERAGVSEIVRMQLIDSRGKKREAGLTDALIAAITQCIARKEQVLIFLNRRGYAPVFLCSACGWQANCPRCDAHLTLHYQPSTHLQCHHCAFSSRTPSTCPTCHSDQLNPTGVGTARLEAHLKTLFPSTPLLRVDRDTTKRVGSWEAIYARAQVDDAAILLGTQMLAKGHHFPFVTLVAILDADGGFLGADFRAPERTAQIMLQVAGRAGRALKKGQVLIQTWQPDNPLLLTLIRGGYPAFAQQMLAERLAAKLPPYTHAALVRAESGSAVKTQTFLNYALAQLQAQPHSQQLDLWGPIPAPMEKRAGVFRAHLLILCPQRKLLHSILQAWWISLTQSEQRRGLRLSLDIDPQEMS